MILGRIMLFVIALLLVASLFYAPNFVMEPAASQYGAATFSFSRLVIYLASLVGAILWLCIAEAIFTLVDLAQERQQALKQMLEIEIQRDRDPSTRKDPVFSKV